MYIVKLAIIIKNVNEILLIKLLMHGSMLISRFFSFWFILKNRAGPEQESDVNGRKQGVCLKYNALLESKKKCSTLAPRRAFFTRLNELVRVSN